MSTPKPLLLIDVDGPLTPYAAKATRRPAGYRTHRIPMSNDLLTGLPYTDMAGAARRNSLRIWLNPMLLAMTDMFDLCWATAWVDEANSTIAPLIGLPEMPIIRWNDYAPLNQSISVLPPYGETRSARMGGSRQAVEMVHWKTRPIARYTALLDGADPGEIGTGRPSPTAPHQSCDRDDRRGPGGHERLGPSL